MRSDSCYNAVVTEKINRGDTVSKKVYVSVVGTTVTDGESDQTELVTEGEYVIRNGKYMLRYQEDVESFGTECSTIIKFDNDTVVMTRSGGANTQMIFENGKRHISHYETPLGSFTIGVSTDRMVVDVNENGGNVEIDYILDINSSAQVENKLRLNIRGECF